MSPNSTLSGGRGPNRARQLGVVAAFLGCAAALGGCASGASDEAVSSASPSASVTGPPGDAPLQLWLSFDDVPPGDVDVETWLEDSSDGGNDAYLVLPEQDAGVPRPVSVSVEGGGRAITFPAPCDKGPDCVRSILEVPDAPELSPGARDFSYGSRLRIDLDDLRAGSNVMQKGFSTGAGGQWKLQVDDARGLPSCVLVATGSEQIVSVLADRTVGDGQWHSVVCERIADELTVSVDGVEAGSVPIAADMSIENTAPIRIAGKHVKADGDPLFGGLDEVFLRVGD